MQRRNRLLQDFGAGLPGKARGAVRAPEILFELRADRAKQCISCKFALACRREKSLA